MTTRKTHNGTAYARNPYVQFDEGEVVPAATPRRGSLLYNKLIMMIGAAAVAVGAYADTPITNTINGVGWRFRIDPDTATAMLGLNTTPNPASADRGKDEFHACASDIDIDAADIPWQFDYGNVHYTVTRVGSCAFYAHSRLTGTLTIPAAVKEVLGHSFYNCSGLTSLVGGDSVTNWQNCVFLGASKLTGTYPDFSAVTAFGEQPFGKAPLTGALKLGTSIETLTGWSLRNCNWPEAVIPSNVKNLGRNSAAYGVFIGCTNMVALWVKGKPTEASQTYTTVYCGSLAKNCTALKLILMGQNTKGELMTTTGDNAMLNGVDGVQVLVPDNGYWDGLVTGGGESNKVWYYGPNRELDLMIDDIAMTATFTPTTENALTNAIAWAPTIKEHFGLDTVISMTNRIDMSVAITESMLQNVTLTAPPWYLTFAVKNQTQLNNVLTVVSADTPIIIDIEGAGKNQITVPNGRKVAILAKSGWTFGKKLNGLVITFH